MLIDQGGYDVTVVDDLSRGSIETILRLESLAASAKQSLHFEELDVSQQFALEKLMKKRSIELVVHFSGNAYVGESMVHPESYFQNITVSTVAILKAMSAANVQRLIFSSSCATFGAPKTFPITETSPQRPTNPYGMAKLQAEQAIIEFTRAQQRAGRPFSAALLRYFNVIGADPAGRIGPHLIHAANARFPRIVDAAYDVALGLRKQLTVTGASFPTKDGSATRDYIHVTDLVDAHVKLMFALKGNELLYYNVGNGKPFTVLEVVDVVRRVTGRKVPIKLTEARPGDPPTLYTDPAKIRYEIGWRPKYPDLQTMVQHGWDWRMAHYDPAKPAPSVDPLAHSGPAFNATTDTAPALGDNPRIVIIGAGPTGLCAAYRLTELGYTNWELVEGSHMASGLACTLKDEHDFYWDIGVHCLFSHFEFFDALLDDMLPPRDWLYHQRYSPARMRNTWVGYPVQANLWRLPQEEVMGIIADLAQKDAAPPPPKPRNFRQWLDAGFGKALTDSFMVPYNAKVWAHPAHEMNSIWVGERVATIRFKDILSNVINRRDAPAWGPNAQFRYPMNGTGHIWLRVFDALPKEHKRLNARVKAVRTAGAKALELEDGSRVPFDGLLSTMAIPSLLRMTPDHPNLAELAEGDNGAADHSRFKHQTCNVIGVGIEGSDVPEALNGVHWVYFPEDEFIFYRVTALSSFSPFMVPKPLKQWSLLIEVSESKYRQVPSSREELRRLVIEGLHKGGMLPEGATIVSVWDKRLEYGYPVPYVERNMHMHAADKALRELGIWSRGRFGSWKYEVGNQDHSCMLGVDAVDSMLFGGNAAGREATFNSPGVVNNRYRAYDYDFDPAALSREAGRSHTFGKPPRRLRRLSQWDWIYPHCHEDDHWTNRIRSLSIGLPTSTKWLVHSYERCGIAEKKRPMPEMLREALDHVDRIPHAPAAWGSPSSAWLRHILDRLPDPKRKGAHKEMPELLVFVRPGVPPESSAFTSERGLPLAAANGADFGMWGSHITELPVALQPNFCKIIWPLIQSARSHSRPCPDRVVSMSSSLFFASKRRVQATPRAVWVALSDLLKQDASSGDVESLLDFGWHMLLGQPAVLQPRFMTKH